jgi:hypothetical protein
MSPKQIVGVLVAVVLMALLVFWPRYPAGTQLPFGTTDLSSVQSELSRLTPEDRALVEAYVKRSNGDVLLPSMADPDQPFTARTFAQAIELEKAWAVKRGEQEVVATNLQMGRDKAMEPLREAVEATVARVEILSPRQLAGLPEAGEGAKQALASNDPNVFVLTVSIHNLGSKTITGVRGSIAARDRDAPLPLDLCWVDTGEQQMIEAASRIEIRCANRNRPVDDQQRAFIDDKGERFTVVWNPKRVVFEDGTVLDSGL